jgi:hypothetical protein
MMMQKHADFQYKADLKYNMMGTFIDGSYQAVQLPYKYDASVTQPRYVTTIMLPAEGKMLDLLKNIKSNPGLLTTGFHTMKVYPIVIHLLTQSYREPCSFLDLH